MASHWRIKHKLLLGLGLVVASMILLMGGTLRGLWSYYLMTNVIRAKLEELSETEKVNGLVGKFVAPGTVLKLVRDPEQLTDGAKKIESAIAAFEEQARESHAGGIYEASLVEALRERGKSFVDKVEARNKPQVGTRPDAQFDAEHIGELLGAMNEFENAAHDLHDRVRVSLTDKLNESRRHYQTAIWILVPSSIVGLLIMIGLMRSFSAWIFEPVRDLTEGVARVTDGDLKHRIHLQSGDEMQDLGMAFNDMLNRLCALYDNLEAQVNQRSRQLVRSERLASVGFLAAGVAHEINNPLASIAFCSEALEARLNDLMKTARPNGRSTEDQEVFARYLQMIQNEAFRCKTITERLLEFSRTGEPRREPTDMRRLVQSVLDVTQHLPAHRNKRIVLEVPPERTEGRVVAHVNPEEMKSVVLNLVVNALESMDEHGALYIRLAKKDGEAELRFTDTGCGMTPEVLDNIFEPFFTRSRSGKGTGLGLTISHLVVSQHDGRLEATSAGPGQGSVFTVRLPTTPPAAAEMPAVAGRIGEAVPQAARAA